MDKLLKGEDFQSRYRFNGQLKTLSPLHVGTGEERDDLFSEKECERLKERNGKVPLVSTVMKDAHGKPLIPGSSLRGVMRHWLFNVLAGMGEEWAKERKYTDPAWDDLTQEQQIQAVKTEFSWLEILFGTPFHEGKIEVWDAMCVTPSLGSPDNLLHWNSESLTYIDTSVAIDPATGTAIEHLLYKTEVVPPGVVFEFNLVGQNLSDIEVGLVLMALQAFNSDIYPIRVGARGGRGYGLMRFDPGPIYRLEKEGLKDWISGILHNLDGEEEAAGYYALPQLDKAAQKELIQHVKTTLSSSLEGNHV